MAKRFIDFSSFRQAWRKLDPRLKAALYWIWENGCDEAGVWRIDLDLFKFENGYVLDVEALVLMSAGAVVRLDAERLIFPTFIRVNNGPLKENYNPHKPAFRALAANGLRLAPSLDEACLKLVGGGGGGGEGREDEVQEKEGEPKIPFEEFWLKYNKGNKKTSAEKWAKLSVADQRAAIDRIDDYFAYKPDGQFRKDGERYLSQRVWEDGFPKKVRYTLDPNFKIPPAL